MRQLDPEKKVIDGCLVDGCGNVQKVGEVIEGVFLRCTTFYGAEHAKSLEFLDLAKISVIKAIR